MKKENTLTREEYITQRNTNSPLYIYTWYIEHFDEKKHKVMLNIEEFFQFFQFWPEKNNVYNIMTSYYDSHFNVLKCPNKQGQWFLYI